MKVTYRPGSNLEIEFEAEGQKGLFEQMAKLQEVLKQSCQKCKKNDGVTFMVRQVDGNKFYELRCQSKNCGATLGFGSHKVGGTLFPQRKDAEGEWLSDGGWSKWNPETKKKEQGFFLHKQ